MAANEFWWQRVANHLGDRKLSPADGKAVVAPKALQQCGFSQCDCPILYGMQKAAFRRIYAAPGNCRRGLAPRHASIDVLKPIAMFVTTQLTRPTKVRPT